MSHASAIVVGAGIVGLALARALARRGVRVVVFERHERAVGASLRNIGAVWPLGVADARELDQARRSRAVWREFCEAAEVWYDPAGCLVPAVDAVEWELLQRHQAVYEALRHCELLSPAAALRQSAHLARRGLHGALWSAHDLLLDPRVALRRLPLWLAAQYEIEFRWKHAVTRIEHPYIWSGGRRHAADAIYIAVGAESAQLLPQPAPPPRSALRQRLLVRLAAQPEGFRLGALLCTPAALAGDGPGELLLAQNGSGELLLDDGGADLSGVGGQRRLIDALRRRVELPECRIAQFWSLPQLYTAQQPAAFEAAPGVTVVEAPGRRGLGLTVAFGLAEDIVAGAPLARAPQAFSARRA